MHRKFVTAITSLNCSWPAGVAGYV